jgi:hypothetical protein
MIITNILKDIPGFGILYALAQNFDKYGDAVLAVSGAASELTTETSDSAVAFKKNIDELKREGKLVGGRVNLSLKQFENPLSFNKK